MKKNWKSEVLNSLVTASLLGAGQSIGVLRSVAGAYSYFEQKQVSCYLSKIADYTRCTRVWSLKRDSLKGEVIIPHVK